MKLITWKLANSLSIGGGTDMKFQVTTEMLQYAEAHVSCKGSCCVELYHAKECLAKTNRLEERFRGLLSVDNASRSAINEN